MGMCLGLTRLPAAEYEAIAALADDNDAQHQRYDDHVAAIPRFAPDYPNDGTALFLDLDKTWDAVCFILLGHAASDGSEDPRAEALLGADVLFSDDADAMDGVTCVNPPARVRELSDLLAAIPAAEIQARLDNPAAMEDVYPSGVWSRPGELGDMAEIIEDFRRFYARAAEAGDAVVAELA